MIFMLSAVRPERMEAVIKKVYAVRPITHSTELAVVAVAVADVVFVGVTPITGIETWWNVIVP